VVAVLATDYMPPATKHLGSSAAALWSDMAPAASERSRKGDRLAAPRPVAAQPQIATVEVVGLRDAAIVYRDRDGRELFRTDPLNNVTIVTKGLALPEVTIRQHAGSEVTPIPAQAQRRTREEVLDQAQDRKPLAPKRLKVPMGCEPAFSPVAQPAMAHHTGRCMAAVPATIQMAQMVR
jgi:hypothetical protein